MTKMYKPGTGLSSGNFFNKTLRRVSFVIIAFALLFTALLLNNEIVNAGKSKTSTQQIWQDASETSFAVKGERQIFPQKYRTLRLNKEALRNLLLTAPREFSESAKESNVILSLPLPDGSFSRFKIVDSPIMPDELAAKFPDIKTYRGQGIDDPSAVTRFDITPKGFHALILRSGTSIYIDPYSKDDTENYISYLKSDFHNEEKRLVCYFEDETGKDVEPSYKLNPATSDVSNGMTLKQYRLALAATGEYTAFQGGTVTLALAAMTTSMNRVNAVYERDLAVRMNFVANETSIIYTNGTTDPYTNNNGSAMLTENTSNLNSVIGTANYDIGHVFSTNGGGVATLRGPCSSNKARGVTGTSSPVNDPFDIDYVAHEMGHQFGANHTFNGTTSNCGGGNRSATAAFEPGSGSTIMAYAGICTTQDLQRNSDDHFHVRSLEEITAFITNSSTGGLCSANSATGNTTPTVNAGPDYNIPANTPFSLTATASDVDGDTLSYDWEEYDLGASTTAVPNTDASGGARPIFRSYPRTTNPTRTFPALQYILNNANVPPSTYDCGRGVGNPCLTGELLPTITRAMNFQVTVRDNRSGGSAINTDTVVVNVTSTAGPFVITQPNTNVTWQAGTNQTVTWNVANTNASPVNCANVNIKLSTDGGQTFPITLASNTPNDGSQSVLIPNSFAPEATSTARIKVEGADNIFFDISNTNFIIGSPTAAVADLSGRIVTNEGGPLRDMVVSLTNVVTGEVFYTRTNSRGYYRFLYMPVGESYIVTPIRPAYNFEPQSRLFNLSASLNNADFVGIPRNK